MQQSHIVSTTINTCKPAAPTPEQLARLQALAAMPDEQIDLSDIPEAPPDTVWMRAADRMRITTQAKEQISLRLDADMLRADI